MSFSPPCHNFIQLNSVYLNMFCWYEWILTRLCTVELNNSARQMTRLNKEKRFRAQSVFVKCLLRCHLTNFYPYLSQTNERKNSNKLLFRKNPF